MLCPQQEDTQHDDHSTMIRKLMDTIRFDIIKCYSDPESPKLRSRRNPAHDTLGQPVKVEPIAPFTKKMKNEATPSRSTSKVARNPHPYQHQFPHHKAVLNDREPQAEK